MWEHEQTMTENQAAEIAVALNALEELGIPDAHRAAVAMATDASVYGFTFTLSSRGWWSFEKTEEY